MKGFSLDYIENQIFTAEISGQAGLKSFFYSWLFYLQMYSELRSLVLKKICYNVLNLQSNIMKQLLTILGITILLFTSCQQNPGELLAKAKTEEEIKQALYILGQDTTKVAPKGLSEGTIAPYFAAVDQNGKGVSLSNLTENGKAVIFFYRGYWCSICNHYLADFQDSLSLITDTGAKVIAIAPETAAYQERTIVKNNLSISVISDQKQQIMNAYKVAYDVNKDYVDYIDVNLKKVNEANVLPVPATYIVNKNGIIEKVFFNWDWTKRPSIQSIVDVLKVEYEELKPQ